jgi:hypothetical protein
VGNDHAVDPEPQARPQDRAQVVLVLTTSSASNEERHTFWASNSVVEHLAAS